jgi:hypothetical protein
VGRHELTSASGQRLSAPLHARSLEIDGQRDGLLIEPAPRSSEQVIGGERQRARRAVMERRREEVVLLRPGWRQNVYCTRG